MDKRKGASTRIDGKSEEGTRAEQMAMVNMDLREVFNRLDDNRDGEIEMSELRSKLANTGAANQLSEQELQRLYRYADINNDKQLNYDEFANMMSSPQVPDTYKNNILNAGMRYVKWIVPQPVGHVETDTTDSKEQYMNEYNCNPPPIFIILISIVELGVFVYYAVSMGGVNASGPVPLESPLIYNPYKRYEAWRFLSYMLIHSGYIHITFNLLLQLLLGVPLEMVHKWWRVAIIYFAGVIAGSLGTSISDPYVYLAGASAGDYSIITAHLATVILNWKEMELPWLQLLFLIIIMGTDVGVAVYNRYTNPVSDKTGYAAHLSGAIAGLLIGIGVLRNLKVRSWENKLWWACIILYITLMLMAIIWNAAFPGHFLPSIHN